MKAQHQRELAQEILSREVGYVRKPHANRLRVALIFPNTYFVGMSNLGFQTIYRLFNDQPDIVCERAFLPPKQELAACAKPARASSRSNRRRRSRDFDVIAFSVSFEWDYTNVLTMLRLAGVPLRAADRDYTHPLVVIGGAVTFVNPEPLAMFADVIAAGEGEVARARAGRRVWHLVPPRTAAAPRPGARLLHAVVLRRRIRRRRHHRALRAARRAPARRRWFGRPR